MNTFTRPQPFNRKKRFHILQAGAAAIAVMLLLSDPVLGETADVHDGRFIPGSEQLIHEDFANPPGLISGTNSQ